MSEAEVLERDSPLVEVSVATPQLPMQRLRDALAYARDIEIVDKDTAEISEADYNGLRALRKGLVKELEYKTQPFKEGIERVAAPYKQALLIIDQASDLQNRKLAAYWEAQKAKQLTAEIQAREAARLEQERLAHEVAAREDESRKQAEALRVKAEAEAQAGNATAAAELHNRATQAEVAGQQDAQQMVQQLQLTQPEPVAEAKSSGVTLRHNIELDSIDTAETAVAIAEGLVSKRAIKHDMVWLRQKAIADGDEFNVPGVVVRRVPVVAAKGARK